LEIIPRVQHILGIGTAALIILAFQRLKAFLPKDPAVHWATRLIALVGVYLFLFSSFEITVEHTIRPEALVPIACVMTLLTGVEFSRRVFLEGRRDGLAALYATLLIITAVANYHLKPAWGLVTLTSLLPLMIAWVRISGRWTWKLLASLPGIFLATIFFTLPEHWLQKKLPDNNFLPTTLLCTHSEFLEDIVQKDALRSDLPYRTALLQFAQDIRSAIRHPARHRYGLSLDPDDIMYRGPLERLTQALSDDGISLTRFCYYYYFHTWKEHPVLMLWKIKKQMEYFYTPKKINIYAADHDLHLPKNYQDSLRCLIDAKYPTQQSDPPSHSENSHLARKNIVCIFDAKYPPWRPLDDYEHGLQSLHLAKELTLPYGLQCIHRLANNLFFPLLLLDLIAAAVVLFSRNNLFSELRPAVFCMLYLASFNFFNCLTIAIIHMMDVWRYHFSQIVMSVVSQGFGILFLVAFISHWLRRQSHFQSISGPGDGRERLSSVPAGARLGENQASEI